MSYTLDDIRAAADKKYGSLEINMPDGTTVELVNALRLPKEKRAELKRIQDLDTEDESAAEEGLKAAIRAIARTSTQAENLLAAVNGDLAVLAIIFDKYNDQTELGEASASQS